MKNLIFTFFLLITSFSVFTQSSTTKTIKSRKFQANLFKVSWQVQEKDSVKSDYVLFSFRDAQYQQLVEYKYLFLHDKFSLAKFIENLEDSLIASEDKGVSTSIKIDEDFSLSINKGKIYIHGDLGSLQRIPKKTCINMIDFLRLIPLSK